MKELLKECLKDSLALPTRNEMAYMLFLVLLGLIGLLFQVEP